MFFEKNQIICSIEDYEKLSIKYKNRKVDQDISCPQNMFYYFNKKSGKVRLVIMPEYEIYKCDHEKGPYYMKRIR